MGRKNRDQPTPPPEGQPQGAKRRGRPIPLWQKLLLGISVVLMLGGGAAYAYSKFIAKVPAARTTAGGGNTTPGSSTDLPDGLASGFGPGGTTSGGTRPDGGTGTGSGSGESPANQSEIQTALDTWSPAIFRLGFSFFAAFAMAYALRQFLKITLVIVGAALIGLFALQYLKVITVDWSLVEGKFDSVAAFLKSQTESFTKFVSGYLPSATSAAAGAFVGFKRK